jgi:hypothetical protein
MHDTRKIKSFEELEKHFTLQEILSALDAKEKQRAYHKTQYLKRQAIMAKAHELGLDKDIDLENL